MTGSRASEASRSREIRRAVAVFAATALLLAAAAGGCTPGGAHDILAIPMTHSYHRPTCRRVMMARTERMTVGEARAAGYQPCPVCKPDS